MTRLFSTVENSKSKLSFSLKETQFTLTPSVIVYFDRIRVKKQLILLSVYTQ